MSIGNNSTTDNKRKISEQSNSTASQPAINWDLLAPAAFIVPLFWWVGFNLVFGAIVVGADFWQMEPKVQAVHLIGWLAFLGNPIICALWVARSLVRDRKDGLAWRALALAFFLALACPGAILLAVMCLQFWGV